MKFNTAFALLVTTMTSNREFGVAASSASVLASEELPPRPTRKTKTVKKDSSSSSSSKPAITTDTECIADGLCCGGRDCPDCSECCNSYHLGPLGIEPYCAIPQSGCTHMCST